MKNTLRRANRAGLTLAWALSAPLLVVLVITHSYWEVVAVAVIVVFGSVHLWRRSRSGPQVSWDQAMRVSRPHPPSSATIDEDRPLIAMVISGEFEGHYVSVVAAAHQNEWAYLRGPGAGEATPRDADLAALEPWANLKELRFLPQGELADEIWRRNFDSIRRGSKFRGLPDSA